MLVEGIWNRGGRVARFLGIALSAPEVQSQEANLGEGEPDQSRDRFARRGVGRRPRVDKDIHFLDPAWVCETIQKINNCDILQPWRGVIFLTSNHEVESVEEVTDLHRVGYSFLEDLRKGRSFTIVMGI